MSLFELSIVQPIPRMRHRHHHHHHHPTYSLVPTLLSFHPCILPCRTEAPIKICGSARATAAVASAWGRSTLSPQAIVKWGQRDAALATTPMREDQVTFCTDEQFLDTVARLERFKATDPVGCFETRSQVLGFIWSPYNLLSDERLTGIMKPCSQLMHDWMHGLFSGRV